jgi:hypothetical protein
MFCFCTIFCEACVFCDVWVFASKIVLMVTKNRTNFSTNCSKACCMNNQISEKWQVRNSASSSFYMIWLLSVDSVDTHLMADSVLALYCIWVNPNIADDLVDGSYHFRFQDSNGLLAQVQNWCDVIRWLDQSIAPYTSSPIFSERTGAICVL